MNRLADKVVALVTGGNSGNRLATARRSVDEGASLSRLSAKRGGVGTRRPLNLPETVTDTDMFDPKE
jgi:NAD(P)-dependent dehydrogenase (short-subunit alcohol dehydrogenase family)